MTGESTREMRLWRRRSRIKDWIIAVILGLACVGFLKWWQAEVRLSERSALIAQQSNTITAITTQAYANTFVIRLEQSRAGRFEARMLDLQNRLEQCYAGD